MTLSKRSQETLEQVFGHPVPRNVRWDDVLRLCQEVGAQVKDRGARVTVTFAGRAASFHSPHGKAVDKGAVAAVRNLLRDGGVAPE